MTRTKKTKRGKKKAVAKDDGAKDAGAKVKDDGVKDADGVKDDGAKDDGAKDDAEPEEAKKSVKKKKVEAEPKDEEVKKPSTRGRKKKEEEETKEEKKEEKDKDKEEDKKKVSAAKGKGKRKLEDDENDDELQKAGEAKDVVEEKLKETKKNSKAAGATSSNVDVDFSVFDKSIVAALTIPGVEGLQAEDFEKQFDRIADHLLNNCIMFINNIPHRLVEIEFYCNGHKHLDIFTHGSELQKTRGKWYFHEAGSSYKAGSFKGLDLSFGDPSCFGGILLRSLEVVGGPLIEGPSLLVDHVLSTTNFNKIEDLVKTFDLSAENVKQGSKGHPMWVGVVGDGVVLPYMQKRSIIKSARVGLTLKRFKEGKESFIGKDYRYMSVPTLKKGKHYIIVGLHKQGKSTDEIAKLTKSPKGTIEKYAETYERGKKKDWKPFVDATLDPEGTCECIGACEKK